MLKFIKSISKMLPKTQKEDKKVSFVRRDRLLELEQEAQTLWESRKTHEREINKDKQKFFVNFPYPYMNGRLHLGHAYSLTKAEFYARYKSLKGYNVLFPFGFHCTGMPICAAALKLKEELAKYSNEELENRYQARVAALKKKLEEELEEDPEELKRPMLQYEILRQCEVVIKDIPSFVDPVFWTHYFPKHAIRDLQSFGVSVDFRRSFITTSENPYYDSFIRWQFSVLKEKNFIKFGKRASIYSEKDQQMCADHDRAEGEGVNPQEYTLIKIKVIDEKLKDVIQTDKAVYMVAATLRPETMYGQTNCFVLPEGEYGIQDMGNGELWICSDKSARNMSFQYMTAEFGKTNKVGQVKGETMIGWKVQAPLAKWDHVYVWPMLSISMNKGTGVVTSVPSDAPDDYAVLVDMHKKKPFREKYGLTDEMVLPYEPWSIIDVPEYSDLSAIKAYTDFKIKSMNDKNQLVKAKDEVYLKGFYAGILKVGEFTGKKVQDAKPLVKQQMIDNNQAATYYEPEKLCVSRSGDECVVALCDQWYINYGDEKEREILKEYVNSDEFNTFNNGIKVAFNGAIDWLREWGCSRSFGLGTKLPWDNQYLIESLSDSTIYMAYYTIAHYLQSDLEGKEVGEFGIKAEEMTNNEWNYIFLQKPLEGDSKVSQEKLDKMRASFEYWYPFDLRCSGKDLIKNHLTMSLYNHLYIWGRPMIYKGVFCNGWILVNKEKMSKSKGNFKTLDEMVKTYSADATRLGLATAGDNIEDANLELEEADQAILKLSNIENWLKDLCEQISTYREDTPQDMAFYDAVFENEVKNIIIQADTAYNSLVMKDVIKEIFFNMNHVKENYKANCGDTGMNKGLVKFFIEAQLITLYPITPHFCEMMWSKYYLKMLTEEERKTKPNLISDASFLKIDASTIDRQVLAKNNLINKTGANLRSIYEKFRNKKKNATIKKIYMICSTGFKDWQVEILKYMKDFVQQLESNPEMTGDEWKKNMKTIIKDKKLMKKSMEFASFKLKEYQNGDKEAFNEENQVNEQKLIEDNINLVCKEVIDVAMLEILTEEDANKCSAKMVKKSAGNVLPGSPIVVIDF